jgi:hypothetical protein
VPGVESATFDPETGVWRLAVRPATESASVREAVIDVAARRELRMTALRELEPSLEDIYRTAVAGMTRGFAVEEVSA